MIDHASQLQGWLTGIGAGKPMVAYRDDELTAAHQRIANLDREYQVRIRELEDDRERAWGDSARLRMAIEKTWQPEVAALQWRITQLEAQLAASEKQFQEKVARVIDLEHELHLMQGPAPPDVQYVSDAVQYVPIAKEPFRHHRHADVCCSRCGQQVWPRVTCFSDQAADECQIPAATVCERCKALLAV